MHRAFLLAGLLCLAAQRVEAGSILDRDAATQHEVASGRSAADATAAARAKTSGAEAVDPADNLLPGFVQPYGYPLPPYLDGNFGPAHVGR
jgi:hypothetical protein